MTDREKIDGLVDAYILRLQKVKRASPNTVRAYQGDILDFLRFCDQGNKDPLDLDSRIIREYFAYLKGRVAATTLSRRIASLRGFYRQLKEESWIAENPWASVRGPKLPKNLPEFLTVPEASNLVEKPDENTPMGMRDRAMLEVLYGCGLRVAELVGLDVGAIDFGREMVTVKGKGAKYRMVPLGEPAIKALHRYITARQELLKPAHADEKALFLNRFGQRITTRSIRRILDKYALLAGISRNVHPHVLRHSYATHMLMGGADLRSIQELLGHSRISTTQKYTHLDLAGLRRVYEATHPRAKKHRTQEDEK